MNASVSDEQLCAPDSKQSALSGIKEAIKPKPIMYKIAKPKRIKTYLRVIFFIL